MASVIYSNSKMMNKYDIKCSGETQKSDCSKVVIAKGNIHEGIPAIW